MKKTPDLGEVGASGVVSENQLKKVNLPGGARA
jgi:hypothetical protein